KQIKVYDISLRENTVQRWHCETPPIVLNSITRTKLPEMPNASFVARPYHGDLLFLRRETPDFFSYTKVRTTGGDPIFFVHAGKQGVLHPYPSTPYLLVWQGFKLEEGQVYPQPSRIDERDGHEAVGGVGDFEGNGVATIVVNEDQGITLVDLEDNAPHSSRRLRVPPGPVAKLV